MTQRREKQDHSVNGSAQRETPHVGIFWLVQTPNGDAKLLTAGCPLDQAEPYGDCLTYGPGHYETWARWRCDKSVDPAQRAIVRAYEYEDSAERAARRLAPCCRPSITLRCSRGS
jgi:hypothetical protein